MFSSDISDGYFEKGQSIMWLHDPKSKLSHRNSNKKTEAEDVEGAIGFSVGSVRILRVSYSIVLRSGVAAFTVWDRP